MKKTFLMLGAGTIALALSTAISYADAANTGKTTVRICTGSSKGNYTFGIHEVSTRFNNERVEIQMVLTNGSLDNNRRLLSGECDMAMSQSDVASAFAQENPEALNTIRPFKTIYSEYVHLLCPVASGIGGVSDLKKGMKVIVGPDGGGSAETWRKLRSVNDEKYGLVQRLPDTVGPTAVSTVKDSKDTCLLWVSGLMSADMQSANATSVNTKDRKPALQLVDFDDDAMFDLKDGNGSSIYTETRIVRSVPVVDTKTKQVVNPGMYPNLIRDGWGDDEVTVPTVDALLLVREDFKAKNGPLLDRMTLAIEDAQPTIWARVNPQGE